MTFASLGRIAGTGIAALAIGAAAVATPAAADTAAARTFFTIQIPDAGDKALTGVTFNANGVRLVAQRTDEGFRTQQWEFLPGSANYLFKVRQRSNGGCLQIENQSLNENARIVASSCTAPSAEWVIRNLPHPHRSYALINARSGKAITSPNGLEGADLVQRTFGQVGQALRDGKSFIVP
jgi:hypothetical protein